MGDLFRTPVHEYMSKSLVAVRPAASLVEVLHTLQARDVSCVAVTEDDGALRGVVSMTDLMRVAHIERSSTHEDPHIVPPARAAADIMKSPAITIDEAEPVKEAAARMVQNRIHRVIVTRDERAVAVLSTRDMMRVVLFHHIETPVSEVMTSPVETIDVGASIDLAVQRLGETNVRGLVVVDDDWPVGVFTQAEALTSRVLPQQIRKMPVEQVMSYEIVTADVRTPLYRVAGQTAATRARRVLAVEKGRLRGIVTGFDLARIATMA
jgi:CBS domain-containing protein